VLIGEREPSLVGLDAEDIQPVQDLLKRLHASEVNPDTMGDINR